MVYLKSIMQMSSITIEAIVVGGLFLVILISVYFDDKK